MAPESLFRSVLVTIITAPRRGPLTGEGDLSRYVWCNEQGRSEPPSACAPPYPVAAVGPGILQMPFFLFERFQPSVTLHLLSRVS